MNVAPIPVDETERLADVRALDLLDTPPEERFDRIVRLAASTLDVPISYIALIDADRQWFKAKCGITTDETGRDISFCGYAILNDEPLIVPDATLDDRFADNPLVVGEPFIRFYAGYPLKGPHGHNVGTLCLADRVPRTLDDRQLQQFRMLGALAEHELNLMDLIRSQRELIETKNQLVQLQQREADELSQAAAYVRSLLPGPLTGDIRSDWQFESSSRLGGDLFGHHWLDENRLALYLLDVCGHGVGASLLSISVFDDLRRETLPVPDFGDPAVVLSALNRAFPMSAHGDKFTTVWYGVYDARTRLLQYASAGHPPAILVEPNGSGPVKLGTPNLPIGVAPDASYQNATQVVGPAGRLYIYSDGVYEVYTDGGRLLMVDGFVDILTACAGDGSSRTDCVRQQIKAISGGSDFRDDFSLLEVEFP